MYGLALWSEEKDEGEDGEDGKNEEGEEAEADNEKRVDDMMDVVLPFTHD